MVKESQVLQCSHGCEGAGEHDNDESIGVVLRTRRWPYGRSGALRARRGSGHGLRLIARAAAQAWRALLAGSASRAWGVDVSAEASLESGAHKLITAISINQ